MTSRFAVQFLHRKSEEKFMAKNRIIRVQDIPITVTEADMDDYICITDMAAAKSESSITFRPRNSYIFSLR